MMKKKWLVNILILFVSVFIALFVGELAFRAVIFSGSEIFKNLRNPENYASSNNESDYWKLSYEFGGEYKPPKNPHPLLGWIGNFDRETLMHNDAGKLNNRRPVILYGDSYAQCVAEALCFEDFLNNDSAFLKEHYFLNYGVGGYGVDQISLLYKNTIDKFEKPFVVFSLMNYDIDRSILSVRTGQKPYFEIENDSLVLRGTPINQNPEEFFEENPIKIKSLLFRKFLYSKLNFLPDWFTSYYKEENRIRMAETRIALCVFITVSLKINCLSVSLLPIIIRAIL